MLDSGEAGGAAAVAANENAIRVAFGDPGRDSADAGRRHQFDRHLGVRVGVLEIKNKLSQILNGVNVVMRRRRDQTDAGCAVTCFRNGGVHLVAWQLTAFSWLGSLGNLDL